VPISMLRSCRRGRDSSFWMSEMEPLVERGMQVFSVAGFLSAGYGVHCMVSERVNSSQKLLDGGEKGVYSSYTYPLFYLKIVAITLATGSRIVHHIETPGLFAQNCSLRTESTDISLLNELFQEPFWPASAFLVLLDFGKKVVYAAYKR